VEAAATAGLVPDGLVISTPTPDLHAANKSSPEVLRDQLAREPGIAAIFGAIEGHDADALLATFDWQAEGCGGHGTETCPPGVSLGTTFPMIRAGTDWMVTESTLRAAVEALVGSASPARLTLIAQSQSEQTHYVFAYELTQAALIPPTGDNAIAASGVLFDIDATAARPVRSLEVVSAQYPAALESGMDRVRGSQGALLPLLVVRP
jgi:hypothetical protein